MEKQFVLQCETVNYVKNGEKLSFKRYYVLIDGVKIALSPAKGDYTARAILDKYFA